MILDSKYILICPKCGAKVIPPRDTIKTMKTLGLTNKHLARICLLCQKKEYMQDINFIRKNNVAGE